jgi:hypothetical protein
MWWFSKNISNEPLILDYFTCNTHSLITIGIIIPIMCLFIIVIKLFSFNEITKELNTFLPIYYFFGDKTTYKDVLNSEIQNMIRMDRIVKQTRRIETPNKNADVMPQIDKIENMEGMHGGSGSGNMGENDIRGDFYPYEIFQYIVDKNTGFYLAMTDSIELFYACIDKYIGYIINGRFIRSLLDMRKY